MSQKTELSRRLPVEATGAAWEWDVDGYDLARVSMAGHATAPTLAQFTVYGSVDGQSWKATGEVLTPADPVSDEISVSTYRRIRAVCTTGETSELDVVLTLKAATAV